MLEESHLANDHNQPSKQEIARTHKILFNQRTRPAPDEEGVNVG